MAAAIGAGLPIHEPGGNMIVDIGGGTTEVAVISLSGIGRTQSVRIAGDEMDEAIIQHIRKHYRLLVGERRAEEIKIALGSALSDARRALPIEARGARSRSTACRRRSSITRRGDPRGAARAHHDASWRRCPHRASSATPPELAADIIEKARRADGRRRRALRGSTGSLQHVTQLPVRVAEDPLELRGARGGQGARRPGAPEEGRAIPA